MKSLDTELGSHAVVKKQNQSLSINDSHRPTRCNTRACYVVCLSSGQT